MIRFFLILITTLVVNSANASVILGSFVNLHFDEIPAVQFLKGTYSRLLSQDYIMDPSLASQGPKITMSVKNLPTEDLKKTVDTVLAQAGILSTTLGGVPYFYPAGKNLSEGFNVVQPISSNQIESDGSFDPDLIPSVPHDVMTRSVPSYGSFKPLETGLSPVHSAFIEGSDIQFYLPTNRPADQLQIIVNSILGTSFTASDKVFLSGKEKDLARVRKLLEEYDTPPSEVLARALVFEFVESKNDNKGFQLAALVLADKLSIGINTAMNPFNNILRFKNQSIDAVLSAVSTDSRFTLVSAPSIRVVDGSSGRINVGQDVPVLAEATLDKNGNPVQSVTYRPSGVLFDIKPRIMRDRIEVNLSQQLSNFQTTKTSTINSPTLTKREVSTTVGMESGEIIVLGGLDETKDEETRSGLFFLPRFMDSTGTTKTKSQILVVLQVTKISDIY